MGFRIRLTIRKLDAIVPKIPAFQSWFRDIRDGEDEPEQEWDQGDAEEQENAELVAQPLAEPTGRRESTS